MDPRDICPAIMDAGAGIFVNIPRWQHGHRRLLPACVPVCVFVLGFFSSPHSIHRQHPNLLDGGVRQKNPTTTHLPLFCVMNPIQPGYIH